MRKRGKKIIPRKEEEKWKYKLQGAVKMEVKVGERKDGLLFFLREAWCQIVTS